MNRYKNISKEILVERARELECFYLVEEALSNLTPVADTLSTTFTEISKILPSGFRNPEACTTEITFDGKIYTTKNTPETMQMNVAENNETLISDIIVDGKTRGKLTVIYPENTFPRNESAFLPQEIKMTHAIVARIAESISRQNLQQPGNSRRDWEAIITLLQKTDHEMLLYVCEKMFTLLAKTKPESLTGIYCEMRAPLYENIGEMNFPLESLPVLDTVSFSQTLFETAATSFDDAQIYEHLNLWIYQGKTYNLIKIVDRKNSDAKDISRALSQYIKAVKDNNISSEATKRWLKVELMRLFLLDNPKLIDRIHPYISIESFSKLLETFISSPKNIGKIGGKGSGLFIANQILESSVKENPELADIKIPKTWYISSDELKILIEENNLDELNEHKYMDIVDIRTSYPRIIQLLKNAKMSPYILNDLAHILDHSQDKPLIVRSSSLLEDQLNSSFSGKYKSLFLTNTGTKAERLTSLVEGILEVYASMFNPDSIQYRKERNLLDCSEQMGILVQEVVGNRVGPYFFPLFAGVAFSHNELRWSTRIKREDGLLRMVMGLGTRAVDRVGDDFPVLLSPGQPNLRVNQSLESLQKYSPQKIDVLDLEKNQFLTLPISQILTEYGNNIPHIQDIASVVKDDFITDLLPLLTNFKKNEIIISFDYLIKKTTTIKRLKTILSVLQEKLGYPVDIEFASDGENLYLLQCRPQSRTVDNAPAAIPSNISLQNTVFTADKYISNGTVTGIKTVIYVDPSEYSALKTYDDLMNVGRAISALNSLLPRKSFILLGPGRWGSRGDIKLGVPIAYSDINNTAMLIEIANKESRHQPELSFGTHFFQDLVEENIKYLPLYPEDENVVFNMAFFSQLKNTLSDISPQFAYLEHVVKVIQIQENYFGHELIVLMNADLEKAVAYIDKPVVVTSNMASDQNATLIEPEQQFDENPDHGWKWRHYMAEQIAAQLDFEIFAVQGIYLFGSTNSGTARLNSDIDLLIHFTGTEAQKTLLDTWLSGWSRALSEINYLKTGYQSEGLLDIHYVSDQDIAHKTSYAIKIDSVYDPAFPLRVR